MALFYVLSVIFVIFYGIYYFSKRKFNYWKDQNVPHLEPTPIFGNYKDYILMRRPYGEVTRSICEKFPNEPYIGTFFGTEPALLVQDPEVIKLITTKDFYYFSSRETSKYTDRELSSQNNMFFTYGDQWRVVRQNSTPLFSSAKIKKMFHLVEKCAQVFQGLLDKEAEASSVDMRALTASYQMDVLGACAFGIDTHVMTQPKGNPFLAMRDIVFHVSFFRGFKLLVRAIWPAIFYGLRQKVMPVQLNDFFDKFLKDIFKARQYKHSGRNDFVDLMLDMNKADCITGDSIRNLKTGQDEKVSLKCDDNLLVSQCLSFFGGGFETSSTTFSHTLYELAKNQEAQKKVCEEVDAYLLRHKNKLEYECVSELPYLGACVDEALRLYPVLSVVTREVFEDYTLPSGVLLKKGVRVHLPVFHIHRKAEFFPEPEKFRPERFLGEAKRNIKPFTFMPFGEGPRTCIGMRFARMTMMSGLITVLKSYRVELAPGTPVTLKMDPRTFVTRPCGGAINLRLVPRPGREERVYAA